MGDDHTVMHGKLTCMHKLKEVLSLFSRLMRHVFRKAKSHYSLPCVTKWLMDNWEKTTCCSCPYECIEERSL